MKNTIETIHLNFVNGNRRDAVKQIKRYGLYIFWNDYGEYLKTLYTETDAILEWFSDAVISYHRITNR